MSWGKVDIENDYQNQNDGARKMTLDQAKSGQMVEIKRANRTLPFVQRLMEMGLTIGTKVKIIRRAPFFGPLQVNVRGSSICMKRDYASAFEVLPARVE